MRISDWSSDVCSSDLNYQTLVCDLTGLDVANASLLDEATAAAEAMGLAARVAKSKAQSFFVDSACHPQTITLLRTHAEPLGWALAIGDPATDLDPAAVFGAIFQYPGTTGEIRDFCPQIRSAAHTAELQSLMRSTYDVRCLK